jgi:hypothetical protein
LCGSNEEEVTVLHVGVERFKSAVQVRILVRVRHFEEVRQEGQTGRAVVRAIKKEANE